MQKQYTSAMGQNIANALPKGEFDSTGSIVSETSI